MKRPSLKLRITAWFALMMFVIEALVLAFLLAVNGTVATNDPEARLVRMVEHNADRVKYNHRQFRYGRIHYNRSGVYTVLYDADGNVLQARSRRSSRHRSPCRSAARPCASSTAGRTNITSTMSTWI